MPLEKDYFGYVAYKRDFFYFKWGSQRNVVIPFYCIEYEVRKKNKSYDFGKKNQEQSKSKVRLAVPYLKAKSGLLSHI